MAARCIRNNAKVKRKCRHNGSSSDVFELSCVYVLARDEEAGREARWFGWQPALCRKRGPDAPLQIETASHKPSKRLRKEVVGETPGLAGWGRTCKSIAKNRSPGRAPFRVAVSRYDALGTSHRNSRAPEARSLQALQAGLLAAFPATAVLSGISWSDRIISQRRCGK